jgi:hypothetical protein
MPETNQRFKKADGKMYTTIKPAQQLKKELEQEMKLTGDPNIDSTRFRIRRRPGGFELVRYERIEKKEEKSPKKKTK